MKVPSLNCENARNILIINTLKSLGHLPKRETEKEAWFLSPFRSETQASFKVCKKINRWFDHGQGTGGNVIDLVMTLKNYTVSEALYFFSDINISFSFQKQTKNITEPKTNYQIKRVKQLENRALLSYLDIRAIHHILAKKYCQEIYYTIDEKTYFGIAFKNRSGGYELRNKYFKGCIGKKDFTHYQKGKNNLTIFEGFFDFLSFITLNKELENQTDFLILNSLSLVQKIEIVLKEYDKIYTWLDNDNAGKSATKIIKNIHSKVEDKSVFFDGYKDLNEHLISIIKQDVKSQKE